VIDLNRFIDFLCGKQSYDEAGDVWFSDNHPDKRGKFWWRRELREHVAALEDQLKDRAWISVEDRLPPEKSHGFSDWILVATNHDGAKFVCQDKRDFHDECWVQSSTNVTHWMPLPSPPIGDKE